MKPPKVYYRGRRGTTEPCYGAVLKTLEVAKPLMATLVSSYQYHGEAVFHGFVFAHHIGRKPCLTVVVDGFSSGYNGSGPNGLLDSVIAIKEACSLRGVVIGSHMADDLYNRKLNYNQIRRYILEDDREQSMALGWGSVDDPLITVEGNGIIVNPQAGSGPQLVLRAKRLRELVPGWAQTNINDYEEEA